MINPLPIVRAEFRRTRATTVAAVVLVAVAVALGVAVTSQERTVRSGTARAAEAFDVLIGARGSPTQLVLSTVYLQPAALDLLPGSALGQLDAERGVAWTAPIVFGDSYRGHAVIGTTAALVTHGGAARSRKDVSSAPPTKPSSAPMFRCASASGLPRRTERSATESRTASSTPSSVSGNVSAHRGTAPFSSRWRRRGASTAARPDTGQAPSGLDRPGRVRCPRSRPSSSRRRPWPMPTACARGIGPLR